MTSSLTGAGESVMQDRPRSTDSVLTLLTGSNMASLPRMLWRTGAAIVFLESLTFWLGLLPEDAAHWLLLRTRFLVLLGPPLGFSSATLLSSGIGIVGSVSFLCALRKTLGSSHPIEAIGWGAASVVLWMVFGIVAAAPIV